MSSNQNQVFEASYKLIESLLSHPDETNRGVISRSQESIEKIEKQIDGSTGHLLKSFLSELNSIGEEYYIQTFELSPECPLYLGWYKFEEPKTCAGAATSKRNIYMIELKNIYRHFGLESDVKELPDYLPLMIEFLWLTLPRREPLREKFIGEYMMPMLPDMISRLEMLKSPYQKVVKALYQIVKADCESKEMEVNTNVVG